MRSVRRRHLILGAVGTLALVALVTMPGAMRGKVGDALDGLSQANPAWLWAAGLSLAVMHACSGMAWSAGLRACGTRTRHVDATARYCIGSGVNAVAPAHLGSAARIALFGRAVEGKGAILQVSSVAAAVAAVRTAWFSILFVVAVVIGPMPAWPLALLGLGAAGAVAGAAATRKIKLKARFDPLLDAFRELARSPRKIVLIAILTFAGLVAKVAAAAAIAAALGIDSPWKAAALIVPAVEVASVLPITPGNAGVASAAIAMALASIGVPSSTALAVGIGFGAIEMLCAIGVGLAGALALTGPRIRPQFKLAAVSAATVILAASFGLSVLPV